MRKLTRLTAASVATLTLTAGSFAALAAAHHSSTSPADLSASSRHDTSAAAKAAANARAVRHGASVTKREASARGTAARATTTSAKWSARPEQFPKTVTLHDLKIPMDDGVVLRGDLTLPADANGKAIDKKFPVVATITAYNKGVQQYAGGLAGGDPKYLVQRGYAQLTVDARGTGTSAGQWCAFCSREDKDFGEVMQWAHGQSWSNGLTAMDGPSYMGIAQMFAAAAQPDGLKAIFPQVPGADVYRDVVASGGQLDVGFIPLWLGLVTVTGLIPPTAPPSDASPLLALAQHLVAAGNFTLPLILKAFAGQEPAYDGPFYAQRSPINVVNKVKVPTFFVSGEYDLFQRGTPLLFENLQKRGVPTKLIVGPWNHLQASGGAEVGKAGLGSLDELKLRWFDHYVKGLADPTLDSDIPPLTYYEQGTGAWKSGAGWMKNRTAATYKLSGTSKTAGAAGSLTTGAVTSGSSSVYPIPVSGLCTRSTDQWTAGAMSEFPFPNPCNTNNAWNDKTGVVFSTAPVTKAVTLQGPINARLYVSSNSGDGMLSVAVEDEAPDGTVSRLTGGWQVISMRALNTAKSRYLDGQLIQPFHPFTKASKARLAKGSVAPVDVEVFPTGAKILPGHRLRIAVQAFDIPHLAPVLPDILSTLTVIKIFNSTQYPSRVTLPLVD
ncbi:MAG: CocE/NonD family hydrolase [Marmoricola sp.]